MTNVTIIDVDLGITVESIINDDVSELTAENKRQIDEAIREAQAQQAATAAVKEAKDRVTKEKAERMEVLYAELLATSQAGPTAFLSSQRIMSLAAPDMTNMISFVGRMRNWLLANDKPYRLTPIKMGKEAGYRLSDLN